MEIKTEQAGSSNDFDIPLREERELLNFALQLAAPCPHCSMKAMIALTSSKLLCLEGESLTCDSRYMDARYILSGAVMALESLDEAEAEDEHAAEAEGSKTASSHLH